MRPALDILTTEECPVCHGTGQIQPSLLFTDTLHDKLDYLVNTMKMKNFIMYVHPFVAAYIKKGILSLYRKWQLEFGLRFRILPDQSLPYLSYKVLDSDRNEIDLNETISQPAKQLESGDPDKPEKTEKPEKSDKPKKSKHKPKNRNKDSKETKEEKSSETVTK